MVIVQPDRFSPLPREHGVYGQVGCPLAAVLLTFGVHTIPLALIGVVLALFLAHEPLQVVTGGRGARVRPRHGRPARAWIAGLLATAAVLLGLAASAGRDWMPWAAPPVLLLIPVAAAIITHREKSWWGESAVAAAASSAALPVAVASGASPSQALALALPFALTFVLATLAVRAIVARVRAGGNATEVFRLRLALVVLAVAGLAALAAGVSAGLPPVALWTSAPGALAAGALARWLPPPAQLRTVGWGLVALAVLQTVLLAVWLRG